MFDDLTLSGPNTSGPCPNVLFSLLSPKTARISASVPNRKYSGNESATRKMHQMSYCKAVKQPLASFRLLLIESCAVICVGKQSPVSVTCENSQLQVCMYISILHVCMFTNMKLNSWSSTYAVSAIIDYSGEDMMHICADPPSKSSLNTLLTCLEENIDLKA